jgi:hypothetical protein
MNRLILGVAIGIALCGPAFAMNEFGVAPNAAPPTVIAGSVSYDGTRVRGSGFSVKHLV